MNFESRFCSFFNILALAILLATTFVRCGNSKNYSTAPSTSSPAPASSDTTNSNSTKFNPSEALTYANNVGKNYAGAQSSVPGDTQNSISVLEKRIAEDFLLSNDKIAMQNLLASAMVYSVFPLSKGGVSAVHRGQVLTFSYLRLSEFKHRLSLSSRVLSESSVDEFEKFMDSRPIIHLADEVAITIQKLLYSSAQKLTSHQKEIYKLELSTNQVSRLLDKIATILEHPSQPDKNHPLFSENNILSFRNSAHEASLLLCQMKTFQRENGSVIHSREMLLHMLKQYPLLQRAPIAPDEE